MVVFLKIAGEGKLVGVPSREKPDISLSSKAHLHLLYTRSAIHILLLQSTVALVLYVGILNA